MTKTPVKFQKNQHKNVGGVAHTRYPLSIRLNGKNARKMTEFNLRKNDKKLSEDYIQITCICSDHIQNTCDVSKESL